MRTIRLLIAKRTFVFVLACLQVLFLVCVGIASPLKVTRVGQQCPTAAVQAIHEKVVAKSCCGKEILIDHVRTPVPGDREFKQCCCAEKKSAERQEIKVTAQSSIEKFAFVAPSNEGLYTDSSPLLTGPIAAQIAQYTHGDSAPTSPPPNLV